MQGLLILCHVLFELVGASWNLVADDGPSARSAHAATLGENQILWIHAGKGEVLLEDLWAHNNVLNTWTLVPLFTTAPSARKEHVALTDGNGDLWVQGGEDDDFHFFNDLWKLSANEWTLVSNGTVPSRSSHVAVWDSVNDALWIHGGYDGVFKEDMWKFDVQTSLWVTIPVTIQPSARAHHVAAIDEMNGLIWIHGGSDGGLCQDLWRFNTSSYVWNLISSGGPSARAHHVGVWDSVNDALWLHGGFDGMAQQDLWRFDTLTNAWNLVSQSGPAARFDHVAVWDPSLLAIVIHGGYDQGLRGDLWRYEVGLLTTTVTSTVTSTRTSQTSSSTTSSTTSLPMSESLSTEGLSSEVLALLLVSVVLGLLACCCALYWHRKRQKNREVVPVPPPPPPPPEPPCPKSPQYRVNMQVLPPPPEPQEPRGVKFPARIPVSVPDFVPPRCYEDCCIEILPAWEPPLMLDHVSVDICIPQAPSRPKTCDGVVHDVMPREVADTQMPLCRPKTPGRTGSAPQLPDSGEHAACQHQRRPLVAGRLHAVSDHQRLAADDGIPSRANAVEHIDVEIQLPVSPQVKRVESVNSSHSPSSGSPHRPKVPSNTETAPQLPPRIGPAPVGRPACGQTAPEQNLPSSFGPPARKDEHPKQQGNPQRPQAVDVAVILPKETRRETRCLQPQPVDVQIVLDAINGFGSKCPDARELRLPLSQRSVEVEVEVVQGQTPLQIPQPVQPPGHPAPSELPWPKPSPRLQRSKSAQTPRQWMVKPVPHPKPKTIPRAKSAKDAKLKGQRTSTLGGPWWKGYPQIPEWRHKSRGDWAVLNQNPGPGAYDLEHPRIQGRIPGREPGFPHRARDPDKRI